MGRKYYLHLTMYLTLTGLKFDADSAHTNTVLEGFNNALRHRRSPEGGIKCCCAGVMQGFVENSPAYRKTRRYGTRESGT